LRRVEAKETYLANLLGLARKVIRRNRRSGNPGTGAK
jgi:hypothetical protein